jgi:DNA recombination protein RmuC
MTWLIGAIMFLIGAAAGAGVAWGLVQKRIAGAQQEARVLREQAQRDATEIAALRQNLAEANEKRHQSEISLAALNEQLKSREAQLAEQKRMLDEAEKKLTDVFKAAGSDVLRMNNEQFLKLAEQRLSPFKELLDKQNAAVGEIEKKRETAYVRLDEQIKHIAHSHERLGAETNRLVAALRRPEQRGRWGEMQLRNVVELAGMTAHCDFHEQVQTDDESTRDRPDMVVHLPGSGLIVVDSKVSLDAYLNSIQPDADRTAELQRHSRQVETHVRSLSSKAYWNQFERTPRLVVMFMPLESALFAALEVKPDLHAEAMKQHVLIATPTLLVALLRAIAYGWQQEAITDNAKEIADVGRQLYDRLSTFASHLERVGRGLHGATDSYNKAIGSLERMVLPSTRRLRELHATTAAEIQSPLSLDIEPRDVTAPELKVLSFDKHREQLPDAAE